METRALGKDGPQVPVICFGAWPIGSGMGAVARDQAIATVETALDVGMTFIDTAESYRDSEETLGEVLKGRRDQVFLATKLSQEHSPGHLAWAIDNSLRALGTDYVDLYQLHSPKPEWPIDQTMESLLRLRDAGKIRYIGVSNFSGLQTLEALEYGRIHSSQPCYNMLHRDPEEDELPACLGNGIGVIAYSPLGKGLLTGKYQPGHRFQPGDERGRADVTVFEGEVFQRVFEVTERLKRWAQDHGRDLVQLAIAWTLAHPAVTSSIVGAKSPEQVRHNVKAADWRLSERDLMEIDDIQGDLRLHGW
jgi:aryl-alcohol dehydrogenase-like predicted oxidoreductase